jgi:gamma-tubulin complex component 5
LNGLEERFRVNSRDGLADALRRRLDDLQSAPENWHPEILSLLLQLSDQPTFKSRLRDVEPLQPSDEDVTEPLLWKTIAAEDGWDRDGDNIWESINYADSSDDELYYSDSVDEAAGSPESDSPVALGKSAKDLLIKDTVGVTLFSSIRFDQEWRQEEPHADASGQARKTAVAEVHVFREVLFMLQGLDTTLFGQDGNVNASFQTSHLAWQTHKSLINAFAEYGRQLRVLRRFVTQPQAVAHLEAFQDSVEHSLEDFDGRLVELHARLTCPTEDVVVSLMSLKSELNDCLEPIQALSAIVAEIEQDEMTDHIFRPLELLFENASIAQLSDSTTSYRVLARIFAECFDVYLRPIRLWMDDGRLLPQDQTFFVYETSNHVALSNIWRDRYKLRTSANGKLHAPGFLDAASSKILNAGKNIVLLRRLGRLNYTSSRAGVTEPPLDYDTICPNDLELAPFAHLFNTAFERWMQSKYHATYSTLKHALFVDCELLASLKGLHNLYLMTDGSAASAFCEELFEKLDSGDSRWHDRYALTAIAHEAFDGLVDADRVIVQVSEEGRTLPIALVGSSVRTALPQVRIHFTLAWPVRMILTEASVGDYQSIFSLLLQLKRASHVLRTAKVLDGYWTDHERWSERAIYYACRNSLLWFCTTIQTYLATLVLAPNIVKLRHDLQAAADVDALIGAHSAFVKLVVNEACLGSRLTPLRECMLDILDLAIRLERRDVRRDEEVESVSVLRSIKDEFDQRLRFLCGGLRSVARATSDSPSAKWETLAEMLQTGMSGVTEM